MYWYVGIRTRTDYEPTNSHRRMHTLIFRYCNKDERVGITSAKRMRTVY